MTAVILAAGRGRRLGSSDPKCLLDLGGQTLLRRQIDAFRVLELAPIVVVVGFRAELVREHADADVRFVDNVRFRETDSLYSLWLARGHLRGGFVVANADVLLPPVAAGDLMKDPCEDVLLVSRSGPSGPPDEEATKVSLRDDRVADVGKNLCASVTDGEYVGVAKFGPEGAEALVDVLDRFITRGEENAIVPTALRAFLERRPLGYTLVRQPWIEIDFPHDVRRAVDEVLPAISP